MEISSKIFYEKPFFPWLGKIFHHLVHFFRHLVKKIPWLGKKILWLRKKVINISNSLNNPLNGLLTILNGPIKKISYDYLTDDYGDKIILLFCSHTDYMGSVILYEQFLHAVSNIVMVLIYNHIEDRDGAHFHESTLCDFKDALSI